jgi:hypothetical protein
VKVRESEFLASGHRTLAPPSSRCRPPGHLPHELAKLVREGKIPAPSRRLGPKRLRYDLEALDKAMLGEDGQAEADRQRSYDEAVAAVVAEIASHPKRGWA